MLRSTTKIAIAVAFGGPLVFVVVVLTLQGLQPGHDPAEHLMSVLALGPHGEWLSLGFYGLSSGILATRALLTGRAGIRTAGSRALFLAAVTMAGAGLVTLGDSSLLHISLIAVSFVLLALVMLLGHTAAPRRVALGSRTLALLMLASIASEQVGVPLGLAQRGAAGCVLVWIVILAATTRSNWAAEFRAFHGAGNETWTRDSQLGNVPGPLGMIGEIFSFQ
jgi:hypothetical protein